MRYEEAIKELEKIIHKIESGDMDIDDISAQIISAKELIKLCRDKLIKTEEELKLIDNCPS